MYKMHEVNGVKPIYRGVNTEGSGTVVVTIREHLEWP